MEPNFTLFLDISSYRYCLLKFEGTNVSPNRGVISSSVNCIETLITVAEAFFAYYTLAVVCNIIEVVLLSSFFSFHPTLSFGHGTALCYSEPIRTPIVRWGISTFEYLSKEWEIAPCLSRRVLSDQLTMNFLRHTYTTRVSICARDPLIRETNSFMSSDWEVW